MNIQTVPVQILVVIFGSLIAVIAGLNLYILNKIQKNMDKTNDKITTLETNMDTKLEKKADKSTIDLKLDTLLTNSNNLDTKVTANGLKLNEVAENVAFLKGKEEARRELATK